MTTRWDRGFVRSLGNTSFKKQCHCVPPTWKLLSQSSANKKYLTEVRTECYENLRKERPGVQRLLGGDKSLLRRVPKGE